MRNFVSLKELGDQNKSELMNSAEAVPNPITKPITQKNQPKMRGFYEFDLDDPQLAETMKEINKLRQVIYERAVQLLPRSAKLTDQLRPITESPESHPPLALLNHKMEPSSLNSLLIVKRFLDDRAWLLADKSERLLISQLTTFVEKLINHQLNSN